MILTESFANRGLPATDAVDAEISVIESEDPMLLLANVKRLEHSVLAHEWLSV